MSRRLVLAIIVILAAGCSAPGAGGPSPSNGTSSTPPTLGPNPSSAPTIGPIHSTAEPTGPSWTPLPPEALLIGAAIRPTVAELNMRDGPSTSAKSLGVVTPDDVIAIQGSQWFEADGFTWYRGRVVSAIGRLPVLPDMLPQEGEPYTGWFAVAKGATAYVEQLAPRCPTAIDLYTIGAMLESELLSCFGNNTIELEAVFGCGGCGGYIPGSMEPRWLAHPYGFGFGLLSVAPLSTDRWGALVGHAPPEGPAEPPQGSVIRLRGHFDDERADECRIALPLPGDTSEDPALVPIDQASATLYCRQRFVVEGYEILGTDPDFVPG